MDQLLKVEKSKVSSKDLLIRKKTQLIDQNLKILVAILIYLMLA